MTRLIVSIAGQELESLVSRAQTAMAEGADLVELRLDALTVAPTSLEAMAAHLPTGRWIATYRSRTEGGAGDLADALVGRLLTVAADAGAIVDVEESLLARDVTVSDPKATPIIVSHHDCAGRPESPARILAQSEERGVAVVAKLAWRSDTVSDVIEACRLMGERPEGRIVIPMGEKGLAARVLAAKFGAWGSFCAPDASSATAPGQVTLSDMWSLYRWDRINPETRVLGVIGSPVAHSLSPALFNAQFADAGWNGVYLPWRIDSEVELQDFLNDCRRQAWFGAHGFSVTIPHKAAALRLADDVEPLAERIGAANTLVHVSNGWRAFNTDYVGALVAIEMGMGLDSGEFKGLRVAILGAGGVARAVVAGLCDRGAIVTIYNRTAERAGELAGAFGCRIGRWDERVRLDCDLVVNCTSVGMHPQTEASPLPPEAFEHRPAVFDTVYNPMQTKLLRDASEAGCGTIDGVTMFVQQAAAQYRIWTDQDANPTLMEQVVRAKLTTGNA